MAPRTLGKNLFGEPIVRNERSDYEGGGGIGGHTRPNAGESDVWLTPPGIVDAVSPEGGFAVDPCCPRWMPWITAHTMLTREFGAENPKANTFHVEDGRDVAYWTGPVWLNPPYSEVEEWLELLAGFDDGIALVFARTETRWFQRQVLERAAGLKFLEGRLHFCHPDGTRAEHNAGGPSVFVAYGLPCLAALEASALPGKVVRL